MASKQQEPKEVVTKKPIVNIEPNKEDCVDELKPAAKKKSRKSKKSEVQEKLKPTGAKRTSISTEQQEPRRHLSVLDQNRGSISSAGGLDDSVFAEARSRLGSLASSITKHRRSLSRGRLEDSLPSSETKSFKPCRCSPPSSPQPSLTSPLPPGVLDLDTEEDGCSEYQAELMSYLRSRERMCVVASTYLQESSVTGEMRAVLVDWILQVGVSILALFQI